MSSIQVNVGVLKKLVELGQAVIIKKAGNPLFDNIEFSADQNKIQVRATDGNSYITLVESGGFTEFEPILINPAPLLGILKNIDDRRNITLVNDHSQLCIDIGGKKPYVLRLATGGILPPNLTDSIVTKCALGILKNLKLIESAVEKEKSYVLLKLSKGLVSISATNGYKLAKLSQKTQSQDSLSLTLDKGIASLASSLSPDTIEIDKGNRLIKISGLKGSIVTKQILDPIPDVDLVINNEPEHSLKVETEDMLRVIRRLQSLNEDLVLKVSIKDNTISLSADEVTVGSGEEELLTASIGNKKMVFYIKASYFLQSLQNFDSVTIMYSNSVSPIFISGKDLLFVVMPVRV